MEPEAAPKDATATVPAYVSIILAFPSIDDFIEFKSVVSGDPVSVEPVIRNVVSVEVSIVGISETGGNTVVVKEVDSSEESIKIVSEAALNVLVNGDNLSCDCDETFGNVDDGPEV